MGVIGEAWIDVLPLTSQFAAKLEKDVRGAVSTVSTKSKSTFDTLASVGQKALTGLAIGAGIVGVASVKMAGDFETSMTQLVTGAGESEKNIKQVSEGILRLAPQVGETTKQLASGMYLIESAGFHGADGLTVLKAAAQGAKVGNADLGVVSNAVTTILNAYGLSAKDASSVTSQMVQVVASGKVHMQDLAGALSSVLPVAAAAHLSFAEVGGAIATLTGQGVSANEATQQLSNTIRNIQNPSQIAVHEMSQMGLNANDLSVHLGERGLTGTLEMMVNAVTSHMGPAGLVLQNAFNQSKFAAQDATEMFNHLTPAAQKVAQGLIDGSLSAKELRTAIKALPADQANLVTQFQQTENRARGFNDALKSGSPEAQTFSAALSKMTGGADGLRTTLELTGPHMGTFKANVAGIAEAAKNGADNVQGWDKVQGDFNFKLDQWVAKAQVIGIELGTKLLPIVEKIAGALADTVNWLSKHHDVAIALAGAIGGLLVPALVAYTVSIWPAVAGTVAFLAAWGPLILAFAGLGALVALVITHWNTMGDGAKILAGIFAGVLTAAITGWVIATVTGAALAGPAIIEMTGGLALLIPILLMIITHWGWVKDHLPLIAIGLGVVTAAVIGLAIAFGILDAIPVVALIVLIVGGLIALGIAIYELVTHWSQVWGWIKDIVGEAVNWIKDHLYVVLFIPVFGWFVAAGIFIAQHWGEIWGFVKQAVSDAVGVVMTVVHGLADAWNAVWAAMSTVVSSAWAVIKTIWDAIYAAATTVLAVGFTILRGIVEVAWAVIHTAIEVAWAIIKPIWDIMYVVIKDVLIIGFDLLRLAVELSWALIRLAIEFAWIAIQAIWNAIKWFIENVLAPAFMWLLHNVIEPVWAGIRFAIDLAWQGIQAIWNALVWFEQNVLAPVAMWLWHNVIEPVWAGIRFAIDLAWQAIQAIWNALIWMIQNVLNPTFQWLWHNVIEPVWGGIRGAIDFSWNVIKGIWQAVINFVRNDLGNAFTWIAQHIEGIWNGIKDTAGRIWDGIVGAIKTGVNGVIDAINWVINGINKAISLIPGVHPLKTLDRLAAGGIVGTPGPATGHLRLMASGGVLSPNAVIAKGDHVGFVTRGPALVGEGNPAYAEYVIPTDPVYRTRARMLTKAVAAEVGLTAMASGGIVSEAQTWRGVPYLWGGGHGGVPESVARSQGVDCSGLVIEVFRKLGANMEGNTLTQIHQGQGVGDVQVSLPGDLVFFSTPQAPGEPHHVGIMTSPGSMIDAAHTGTRVRDDAIAGFGHIAGIRRILGGGGGIPLGGIANTVIQFLGGIYGDTVGAISAAGDLVGDVVSAIRMGAADLILKHLFGAANSLFLDHIPIEFIRQIGHHVEDVILHWVKGDLAAQTMAGAPGSGLAPNPGSVSGNAALGEQMAAARGWTGAQWNALYQLEMMEAGWNNFARNPSSGAYGIPQALPPTKMPFAAQAAGGSNAGVQIQWMLDYIAGRYVAPIAALAHEQNFHWYDQGGPLRRGWSFNGTDRDELVLTPSQQRNLGGDGGITVAANAIVINITITGEATSNELHKLEDLARRAVHDGLAEVLDRFHSQRPGS